ncbi:PREDICTED: uncharacterized protein LOC106749306 [Dinoponera quadriceps]|uniref:Uncharacterized protein LOC106749306 n=1 Tax=Dinoponera quadriceps TaxID=609295 RepID=A0A6P3XZY9_DINQU|nr:PREDICTED: uncharacterized protein LOC106749306 [Dinoponera quadriceps]
MKPQSSVRLLLALVATIEVSPAPTRDFELIPFRSIWQNVGVRGFYGPWNILVKRNGDYVDYADYGASIEQYQPNLPELQYSDVSITDEVVPSAYDNVLSKLNTALSSVGLADFRSGIRTGDWIDRNTDGPVQKEQGYREDIDSQEVDGDTVEADDDDDDATTPDAADQKEIL